MPFIRLESYPIAALTIKEPGTRRRYSLKRLGFLKSDDEAGAVMMADFFSCLYAGFEESLMS